MFHVADKNEWIYELIENVSLPDFSFYVDCASVYPLNSITTCKGTVLQLDIFFLAVFTGKPSWILHRNYSKLLGTSHAVSSAHHTSVENEQLLRQRTISQACMDDMPKRVEMRFFVNNRHKVGICLIPKLGPQPWGILCNWRWVWLTPTNVHNKETMQGRDLHIEKLTTRHTNTTFKTIMFVRNPISRLISAYKGTFLVPDFTKVKRTIGRQIIKNI